jgi:hypothetical protein
MSESFSVLMHPLQSYDYIQIVQAAARSPLRAPAANMLQQGAVPRICLHAFCRTSLM